MSTLARDLKELDNVDPMLAAMVDAAVAMIPGIHRPADLTRCPALPDQG